MSLEKVKIALKGTPLETAVKNLPHTGATVDLAADALQCNPEQIAKTMSFLIDDQPILIVVSGLSRIDNKKYRQVFHKKAKMIPFDSVEALIGHAPGGVCPFGVNQGVEIYLDESLKNHDFYYTAAGDENYIVVTSLALLEKFSGYRSYVDVTQAQENQV